MQTQIRVAIVSILFLLSAGIGGYFFTNTFAKDSYVHWQALIEREGGVKAYQQFRTENGSNLEGAQHLESHIFGEALYDAEGVSGIAVCESDFGFGCFHGFFLAGIAVEGPVFVRTANTACIERFGILGTGCLHGIGHGIVEYIGKKNLDQALALCKQTTQVNPLLGCTSGLFMEAHTPFTILPGEEPPEPHPFTSEAPYGLCDAVPQEYQQSCFFELGGWWQTVIRDNFERMGELCAAVQDRELRSVCALGVGRIISDVHAFEVEGSVEACERFALNEEQRQQCHTGAAWSMFSGLEDSAQALRMCSVLEKNAAHTCANSFDISERRGL